MNPSKWLQLGIMLVSGSLGAGACHAANLVGHGGNCLDVRGGGTANGTNVQMWQCQSGNHNQDWTLDNGRLIWSGTNKCLDVAGGGTANGTNAQIWDCQAGNLNQRWALNPNFPGKLVWIGGKCLDVAGGGTANGTNVQLWDCMSGNDNQSWRVGAGTATCVTPAQSHLAVTLRPQQTGMWCWAASGQMVMEYLGVNVQQCTQANDEFGRSDCCASPTPSACVNGGWPQFDKYGFTFQRTSSTALSWNDLQKELADTSCGRRPVAFSWGWTGGGGHMMVAIGYQTVNNVNFVEINDPWAPNVGNHRTITYDFYVASTGDEAYPVVPGMSKCGILG
jgi:hypothetical protein